MARQGRELDRQQVAKVAQKGAVADALSSIMAGADPEEAMEASGWRH